jgi:hypothetical protein
MGETPQAFALRRGVPPSNPGGLAANLHWQPLHTRELGTLQVSSCWVCYSDGHITPQISSYSEWTLVCRLIISNSNQPSTK